MVIFQRSFAEIYKIRLCSFQSSVYHHAQIKTAGSAVYASQYYLSSRKLKGCTDLATGPHIIGDVLIHPTAKVCPGAK